MRMVFLPALLLTLGLVSVSCDEDNPVKSTSAPDPNALSLSRSVWHDASRPQTVDEDAVPGRLLRHRPNSLYKVSDVYDSSVIQGENSVTIFRLIFRPVDAPSPVDQFLSDHGVTPPVRPTVNQPSWAGIMMPQTFELGPDEKYFTVRMRATPSIVHIEFGRFNMDTNGDGKLTSEDSNGNLVTDNGEDLGLDLLADPNEPGYNPANNVDPNNDNFFVGGGGVCPVPAALCAILEDLPDSDPGNGLIYEWLNGTEGNRDDIILQGRPDDELIGDLPVFADEYAMFTLDLVSEPERFVETSLDHNGFRTYVFPLRSLDVIDTVIGTPTWEEVRYVRVWLEAEAGDVVEDTLEIAHWGFTDD